MWSILGPYTELGIPGRTHPSLMEGRQRFSEAGWQFGSFFKFMFVRNPWARAVSLYEHRKMHKDIDAALPFFDWLKAQRVGIEECEDRFRGPFEFRAFAYGEDGQNLADRVIRLEDIDEELPGLLGELQVPCPSPIPRFNATVHDDYVKYYDAASRSWVADRFEFEIDLFRYRFDGR